jgi:hypothetical protein
LAYIHAFFTERRPFLPNAILSFRSLAVLDRPAGHRLAVGGRRVKRYSNRL